MDFSSEMHRKFKIIISINQHLLQCRIIIIIITLVIIIITINSLARLLRNERPDCETSGINKKYLIYAMYICKITSKSTSYYVLTFITYFKSSHSNQRRICVRIGDPIAVRPVNVLYNWCLHHVLLNKLVKFGQIWSYRRNYIALIQTFGFSNCPQVPIRCNTQHSEMEYLFNHTPEEAVIPQIIASAIFFTVFYNGSKWMSNLKSRTYREYFSPRERVDWNNR